MALSLLSSPAGLFQLSAPKPSLPAKPFYPGPLSPSEVGSTGLPADVGFDPLGLANVSCCRSSELGR